MEGAVGQWFWGEGREEASRMGVRVARAGGTLPDGRVSEVFCESAVLIRLAMETWTLASPGTSGWSLRSGRGATRQDLRGMAGGYIMGAVIWMEF